MSTETYGNSPEDIWDEGWEAHRLGRGMETNPFRTGEAEALEQIGRETAALNDGVEPTLGAEDDSTPGSSFMWAKRRNPRPWRGQRGRNDA